MIKPIKSSELKTKLWREQLQIIKNATSICYDRELDALIVSIDNPKERIITHYLDSYVALLYRYSDKELIGIKIESFSKRFLQLLKENRTWKLSDTGTEITGIKDIVFGMEESKPERVIWLEEGVNMEPVFA